MNKKTTTLLLSLLFMISLAQAGIFELYGIGNVGLNYSVSALGRGKSSTAYSDSLTVNLQNPANLAYLRNAGLEMSVHTHHNMIAGTGNTNNFTGFNYGLMKFPLASKGAFTFGIVPLTSSNAACKIEDTVNGYSETARAIGNIYAASFGIGYSFFKRGQLAIGAAADVLIGGYSLTKEIDFTGSLAPVTIESDEGFGGTQFSGGINISPIPQLSIGAAYTMVTSSSRRQIVHYMSNPSTYFYSYLDTVNYTDMRIFPNQLRVGLALKLTPRYILTADWMQYQFEVLGSDFSFNPFYETATIRSYNHYGAGLERRGILSEYVPYYQSLTYRFGLFYDQHYMADSQGVPVRTIGISLGIGLPFTQFRNRIDAAFVCEYNYGTIYEQTGIDPVRASEFVYHFKVSISIAETWFRTRSLAR
ncbi:MAG: hypothetical protein K0B52_04415 [FCB group bacterium]|nr:hypothetical protein [FCB group bacterium]